MKVESCHPSDTSTFTRLFSRLLPGFFLVSSVSSVGQRPDQLNAFFKDSTDATLMDTGQVNNLYIHLTSLNEPRQVTSSARVKSASVMKRSVP